MGQGMCAGMRDAWNLSWKLGLVLDGKARESLLDTYTAERRPHVTDIIKASIYLGQIICIADPDKAAERDRAFLDGTAPPPPPFPSLVEGLLHDPASDPLAGKLSPHGTVSMKGRTGRFDDLVAPGFTLLSRAGDVGRALDARQRALLAAVGARIVTIADAQSADDQADIIDLDGKFVPFMASHGVAAMLVRPDFYIFGSAATLADLGAVVDALEAAARAHGIVDEEALSVPA
jgi:3-(3-hydroxy-phenyl)propionate hydroxylase/flavoprotein hydroxylase